jgi:hypothetical protein
MLLLLLACENPASKSAALPKDFDLGTTQDGHYHNDFFELDIYFDPTWTVQDEEQMELTGGEEALIMGDNEALKKNIAASDVNSAYLLSVFKYPEEAVVDFNPGFVVIVENVRLYSNIETGAEYLEQVKKLLNQTALAYTFGKTQEQRIGKKIFHRIAAETTYLGSTIQQEYYSVVDRGFCLNFILTYSTEQERAELQALLDKIRI